jgi:bacteriorhodopsin
MDSHTLLWLTTFIMTAGGLLILFTGKRRTPSEELHTVLHGIVPLIAACSYFAMATGQGAIILGADAAAAGAGAGRIFYFARYIDWTFTTPLLLVTLSMNAMHAGEKRAGAIAGVVLADVMMILTALFFGMSEVAWIKWTWFIISCAAFLGVFYVIWVSQMQANALERDDVRSSYRRNASMLTVLWLVYPIILAVAPDGLNYIGDTASVLLIGIVDVVSKVVYGLLTVASDATTTERDLAESGRSAPLRRAA